MGFWPSFTAMVWSRSSAAKAVTASMGTTPHLFSEVREAEARLVAESAVGHGHVRFRFRVRVK
ncbi:hypothetical protein ACWCRF_20780 [Streptomyces sp. NPDC002405]|uniref:hypothetical protein n=1 Tax=Streptomyces sp. NPDC057596 TaxID=3346178 RepID=UPI003689913D